MISKNTKTKNSQKIINVRLRFNSYQLIFVMLGMIVDITEPHRLIPV